MLENLFALSYRLLVLLLAQFVKAESEHENSNANDQNAYYFNIENFVAKDADGEHDRPERSNADHDESCRERDHGKREILEGECKLSRQRPYEHVPFCSLWKEVAKGVLLLASKFK